MLWALLWALIILLFFFYLKRKQVWLPQPVPWWYVLFFFSGIPALLYQIVWQRALFTLYGVNIESVTMVVTAFMLGLGLGSLLGGMISRNRKLPLLAVFGAIEFAIAICGIVSLRVFHWAATFTAGLPPLQTGLIAFTLIVIPTMLMGATLPLLVSHTVGIYANVGSSVGALYAVNTLGSATGCFCAGLFIMRLLGESGSVALAAAMNAIISALVLVWYFRTRNARSDSPSTIRNEIAGPPNARPGYEAPGRLMSFPLALFVVCVAGFISLAYEIVWYRLFSFTTGGAAKSFAFLLGAYLLGIGFGSLGSEGVCERYMAQRTVYRFVTAFIFAANISAFFVAPLLSIIVRKWVYLWALLPISLAAAFLGAVFPFVCHLSVSADGRTGSRMSFLYLSNIVGSALGSYLIGFFLFDALPMVRILIILGLAGIGLGVVLIVATRLPQKQLAGALIASFALSVCILLSPHLLFKSLYEKLLYKGGYQASTEFAHVVETKSGIATVTRTGVVYGGGIYDGVFNISLLDDRNAIQRAFAVSYFHPNPKEVLMIGLSSGSWAQVIANHPQVKHLTIVEINAGYLQLIPLYPEVASLPYNSKVQIVIDDGRRWLVRNRDRKFDLIMMNTTYHWRSNASNLLSVEFLQLIREHLNPGGVDLYNTTNSAEVQATGVRVFPYGLLIANCLAVSDSPLQLNKDRWRAMLTQYTIDGKPVFDLSRMRDHARLEEVVSMADGNSHGVFITESSERIRARTKYARIVTDDNMGTEWFHPEFPF